MDSDHGSQSGVQPSVVDMSDKFLFKWNNFQSTVSQSFAVLRRDEDFFDVTLVSDDERQMSAHKLILSASSSFFKSILKRNSHSHPLIYLSGVNSGNLSNLLDFIYQGEVELREDQVESFLSVSQKLRIEGLVHDTNNVKTESSNNFASRIQTNNPPEAKLETMPRIKKTKNPSEAKQEPEPRIIKTNNPPEAKLEPEPPMITADIIKKINPAGLLTNDLVVFDEETVELDEDFSQHQHEVGVLPSQELQPYQDKYYITDVLEADQKILDLMTRSDTELECKICGYTSIYKHSVMGHIENRHIEGLSFWCGTVTRLSKTETNWEITDPNFIAGDG